MPEEKSKDTSNEVAPNEFVLKVGSKALSPADLKKVQDLIKSLDVFRQSTEENATPQPCTPLGGCMILLPPMSISDD